jgi:ABC-type antimicrobial peptide transport system permease subunit
MALGARKETVLRMVLRHGLILTFAGAGIGLICAGAVSRFLSSLLFEVTGTDAVTYTVVALALGVLSLIAIYIPARRATRVDPMIALRQG